MTRAMRWLGAPAVLSILSAGCAIPADGEDLGEAQQAQIDPGEKNYVIYSLSQNGTPIGRVLVTGASAGAGFDGNREYWYLTQNVSSSTSLTFTGGSSAYWTSPPSGLGTLSFVTQRRPLWTSDTPQGTMLIESNPLTGERVGIDWQVTLNHGVWSGDITWWHSTTGNIFGPNTTHTLAPASPDRGVWFSYTTSPL